MPANPDGAHQVNRHKVDREVVQLVAALDNAGRVAALNSGPAHLSVARPATLYLDGNGWTNGWRHGAGRGTWYSPA